MDDYVKEAKNRLDLEVERQIEYLTEFATDNDLIVDWVLETFKNKFICRVKEMGVE